MVSAALIKAGERRLIGNPLSLALETFERAESEPKALRCIGIGLCPAEGVPRPRDLDIGVVLDLIDLRFHDLADGSRQRIDQPDELDHRIVGSGTTAACPFSNSDLRTGQIRQPRCQVD